jgi:hypothetical protein
VETLIAAAVEGNSVLLVRKSLIAAILFSTTAFSTASASAGTIPGALAKA